MTDQIKSEIKAVVAVLKTQYHRVLIKDNVIRCLNNVNVIQVELTASIIDGEVVFDVNESPQQIKAVTPSFESLNQFQRDVYTKLYNYIELNNTLDIDDFIDSMKYYDFGFTVSCYDDNMKYSIEVSDCVYINDRKVNIDEDSGLWFKPLITVTPSKTNESLPEWCPEIFSKLTDVIIEVTAHNNMFTAITISDEYDDCESYTHYLVIMYGHFDRYVMNGEVYESLTDVVKELM
jgi:hypothetical protein